MKHLRKISAFSLIEIALAMGIASFALVAMMGLLSVSLESSKAATDDTVLATMANGIMGDLRRQPFDEAKDYIENATPPVAFFDVCGKRLRDKVSGMDMNSSSALANGAIYKCTQAAQPDQDTLAADGITANMLRTKLTFVWPASAATPPNRRVIHASIARY